MGTVSGAAASSLSSGSSYGSSYGYGAGYGTISGYGDGYGDGYGYGEFLTALAAPFEIKDAKIAYWKSGADGSPANGGSGDPVKVGDVQEITGELLPCNHALHATTKPSEWKGERLWLVALHEPVIVVDDTKMAARKRTILRDLGRVE